MTVAARFTRRNTRWRLVAVAGVVVAVALRLFMLHVPLERDEGGYAYIAQRCLAGDHLYRDIVDSKPPGVFVAYGAIMAVSPTATGVRAASIVWAVFTAALFFVLVRRRFDERVAGVATALLALTQAAPAYFGFSANAEMFMVTLVIGALAAASYSSVLAQALAGALIACAALFKPVALADGLPLAVLVLLTPGAAAEKLKRVSAAAVGFAAVAALTAAWFAHAGTLHEFWFWAFGYNVGYTGDLSWATRLRVLAYQILTRDMAARDGALWLAAMAGAWIAGRAWRRDPARLFVPAWLLSAAIGVSASGRYTPHYWQQILPPICLSAAIALSALIGPMEETDAGGMIPRSNRRRLAAALVAIALLVWPTAQQLPLTLSGPAIARTLFGLNPFVEGPQIGAYLRERTRPDETIFVVGSEPQFLFYAGRKSAASHVFFAPLTGRHPNTEGLQKQIWDEVKRASPRYVVRVNLAQSLVLKPDTPRYLFDRLSEKLAADYTREASLVSVDGRNTRLVTDLLPVEGTGPVVLDIYRRKG